MHENTVSLITLSEALNVSSLSSSSSSFVVKWKKKIGGEICGKHGVSLHTYSNVSNVYAFMVIAVMPVITLSVAFAHHVNVCDTLAFIHTNNSHLSPSRWWVDYRWDSTINRERIWHPVADIVNWVILYRQKKNAHVPAIDLPVHGAKKISKQFIYAWIDGAILPHWK